MAAYVRDFLTKLGFEDLKPGGHLIVPPHDEAGQGIAEKAVRMYVLRKSRENGKKYHVRKLLDGEMLVARLPEAL